MFSATKKKRELTIVYPFRAFHNQEFNRKVLLFFLLPPIFNIILLFLLNSITTAWGGFFEFYLPKLGYENAVSYLQYSLFGVHFSLPYIDVAGGVPSVFAMQLTLVLSVIFLLLSFLIPDNFTPLKYFLRAFIFVMFTSLIYFYITPNTFPYNVPVYTKIGLLQMIALLFATPWIYGFTYYLFSYKCIKKILVTLMTLVFLAIAAPLQYLLSAYILLNYSLLLTPALYIFFGLLINIFVIVAFYGYGVSLEQVFPVKEET